MAGYAPFPTLVDSKYDPKRPRIPNCSQPLREGIKTNLLMQTFDSGHEQRRQRSDPRRTFDPTYNVLTLNQYLTLRDFFFTVLNSVPFTWVHPIEKTLCLVRFDMDTFAGETIGHGPKGPLYKLQLKLLQVWS